MGLDQTCGTMQADADWVDLVPGEEYVGPPNANLDGPKPAPSWHQEAQSLPPDTSLVAR